MTAKSKRTNQVFNLSVSTLKPLPVFVCEYYFYENQIKAKQADLTLFAWVRSWWKTSTCKGQEHGRPGGSMWMWKSTVNKRWTQLVLKGDVYSVWWNVKEMTCWLFWTWWCRWPCRNKQIRSQTHCPTVAGTVATTTVPATTTTKEKLRKKVYPPTGRQKPRDCFSC